MTTFPQQGILIENQNRLIFQLDQRHSSMGFFQESSFSFSGPGFEHFPGFKVFRLVVISLFLPRGNGSKRGIK